MGIIQIIREKSYIVKIILVVVGLVLLGIRYSTAQIASYTFDGCLGTDEAMLQSDAVFSGNITCECGLVGESASLDGVDDSILLPSTLRSMFDDDFSLEFYFQIDPADGTTDILSFSTTCTLDSAFTIRYSSTNSQIIVSLAEDINSRIESRGTLDLSNCWHHLLYVKSGLEYTLYLDNEFISTVVAPKGLSVGDAAEFRVAGSPCQNIGDLPFRGVIDQFKIYDRPISTLEANANYLSPGQIANRDTTIFLGESVSIFAGNNCATSVSWSPASGLSNTTSLMTVATPDESTLYTLTTITDMGCMQIDSIRINVLSDDEIVCDEILLPSAFTPNGDQLNDTYNISNIFIIENLISFEVFDRWGTRIFTTNVPAQGWDGSFNGAEVNPGQYIYKVNYTCQGEEYNKLGSFTLLR